MLCSGFSPGIVLKGHLLVVFRGPYVASNLGQLHAMSHVVDRMQNKCLLTVLSLLSQSLVVLGHQICG